MIDAVASSDERVPAVATTIRCGRRPGHFDLIVLFGLLFALAVLILDFVMLAEILDPACQAIMAECEQNS